MPFENVFTHGNLVDLNVYRWGAVRKLKCEDLGIPEDKLPPSFSLGHKKLVPPEVISEFEKFENRARTILNSYSYPFVFGSSRFVPKKRMIDLASDLDAVKVDFEKAADNLLENYQKYRLLMRKEFVAAANTAYERTKIFLKGFDKSKNEFVNEFLERIEASYPSAVEVRKKFRMEYVVYQAALPDLSQASYADIVEESEKIKLMQEAYQISLSEKVKAFVDTVVTDQRSRVQTVLQRLSDNLKADKVITEQTMNCIRNMIDDYEQMDIVGDVELLNLLKAFKMRLLDHFTAKDVRNNFSLRKSIIDEVSILIHVASDQAAIAALCNNYRKNIQL